MKVLGYSVLLVMWGCCTAQERGHQCDAAPFISNGGVDGTRKLVYNSGTYVEYKCQSYYKLDGPARVKCQNGVWSALPECLEPCTTNQYDLAINNLQLKWTHRTKLYVMHGDLIEFDCKSRDYIKDATSSYRVKCNRGKLIYPKCINPGSCLLSPTEMESKNVITERENTEILNEESVVFTCKPGFYRNSGIGIKVTCNNGKLNYPECVRTALVCSPPPQIEHGSIIGDLKEQYSAASSVEYTCQKHYALEGAQRWTCTGGIWSTDAPVCRPPPSCSLPPPHIEHGSIIGGWKEQYQHESSVEYTCDEGYTLEGIRRLTCTGGSWSADAPICRQSCYLSQAELRRNNLELLQADPIDEPVKHKQSVDFKCKDGYIEQASLELSGHCDNGNIIYPVCAENMPCKVTSEKLDEHNLELHEKHRRAVNFMNGAIIEFKCKSGFRRPPSLLVTCDQSRIIYPTCFSKSPCRILQEDLDMNNVELHEKHNAVMYQNNTVIEFKCKTGFFRTGPLLATCFESKIRYPTCLSERPCLLSKELIDNNNLKFSATSGNIEYVENGKSIDFSCKDQYRKHLASSDLSQVCEKGIIAYPLCV